MVVSHSARGHTRDRLWFSYSFESAVTLSPASVMGKKLASGWPAAFTRFLKCTMFTSLLFNLSDRRKSDFSR